MPKNPSKKQSEASRNNLKGHHGPKTLEGKLKVSLNGFRKKIAISAKSKAKIIHGRHTSGTNTLYSYARCADCEMECLWPSFSSRTPMKDLPIFCFNRVLKERPDVCFYYFYGMCCINTDRNDIETCIVDANFSELYLHILNCEENYSKYELIDRSKSVSYKNEMTKYLDKIKSNSGQITCYPRMVKIIGFYKKIFSKYRLCRFEPWREYSDFDGLLLELLEK